MASDYEFVNELYAHKNAKLNKNVLIFFFLIVVFFVGVFIWMYFSKIDELARGNGKVIPYEKIKIVQSLDGGLISDILVKEGDFVTKNQPLIKIDTTRFQASLEENEQTFYHLLITKTRLEAQASLDIDKNITPLQFDEQVLKQVPIFAKNDEKLYYSNLQELKSIIKSLKTKIQENEQNVKELQTRSNQLNARLKLAKLEADTINKLMQSGSRSKIDLIKAKKELAQLNGELQENYASINKAKFALEGAKNQITQKVNSFKAKSSDELQKVNTQIKRYESKIISESDKLDKTILTSPVNGVIKQIHFNTIGGVIKSGMDLVEIVPQSDVLLVEAKINPKDIAFINPKQKAIVKITAYDFSIYGGLDGKIVEISADSLIDKEDRQRRSYYKVMVKTDKNYLEKNGEKFPIIPGMIASVDIITGQKSILDFILKPILKTKQNALHER